MAIHSHPGIGCAQELGNGWRHAWVQVFLAANLHTLQSFQAQEFQALLESASGQARRGADGSAFVPGVSAARIGQFS